MLLCNVSVVLLFAKSSLADTKFSATLSSDEKKSDITWLLAVVHLTESKSVVGGRSQLLSPSLRSSNPRSDMSKISVVALLLLSHINPTLNSAIGKFFCQSLGWFSVSICSAASTLSVYLRPCRSAARRTVRTEGLTTETEGQKCVWERGMNIHFVMLCC